VVSLLVVLLQYYWKVEVHLISIVLRGRPYAVELGVFMDLYKDSQSFQFIRTYNIRYDSNQVTLVFILLSLLFYSFVFYTAVTLLLITNQRSYCQLKMMLKVVKLLQKLLLPYTPSSSSPNSLQIPIGATHGGRHLFPRPLLAMRFRQQLWGRSVPYKRLPS